MFWQTFFIIIIYYVRSSACSQVSNVFCVPFSIVQKYFLGDRWSSKVSSKHSPVTRMSVSATRRVRKGVKGHLTKQTGELRSMEKFDYQQHLVNFEQRVQRLSPRLLKSLI